MKTITLHSGELVFVSDEDFPYLSEFKWYKNSKGYAVTVKHKKGCSRIDKHKNQNIRMHRLILNFPKNYNVDHINGNRLDNRRENLRLVSPQENANNTHGEIKNRLGFVGVKKETDSCFVARHGTTVIGYYTTAKEAALARDVYVKKLFGEYARFNNKYDDIPDQLPKPKDPKNTGARTSNTKNVSFSKTRKAKEKWRVVINKKHLGCFLTEEDAINFRESYVES